MPRVPKKKLPPLSLSAGTIGSRIAFIRKQKGLTQYQLAEIIGIERSLVANYERDRIRLYDEMVTRFALALGVSTDEILGTTKNKKPQANISLRLIKSGASGFRVET